MIASLVANVVALVGLLFLGWSVWTAVAIYWLENVLSLPVLWYRVRRGFPRMSHRELEAYLAARDSESSNGVSEGGRLRAVVAREGQSRAAGYAARRLVVFYGFFAAAHGVFVFVLGIFSTSMAAGATEGAPDLAAFDWRAIAVAGLLILAADLLGLRLDRRPVMPDVGAYTGRMIVLHVTIVLGAFAITIFGGAGLAILFVALKTAADLATAERSRRRAPGTAGA